MPKYIFVAFDECCDSYVQDLGSPLGFAYTFKDATTIKGAEFIVKLSADKSVCSWRWDYTNGSGGEYSWICQK